uniref:TP53RK-binding protein n=1 Tax=Xenopus tropicalis TaxID=8364 RepID=A0A803JHB6_XENTR
MATDILLFFFSLCRTNHCHCLTMTETYKLELFPDWKATLLLFKNVQNSADLRRKAIDGSVDGTLLNPAMIVDPFQILVAVNKAIHLQMLGKMKTRTLNSEILFNLSPTNNISEAFKKFGLADNDSGVLVVLTEDGTKKSQEIISQIDGEQVPITALTEFTDIKKVKKVQETHRHKQPPMLEYVNKEVVEVCHGILVQKSSSSEARSLH